MEAGETKKTRTGGEDKGRDSNWGRGGGETEEDRDRNKQLKALWHVAQTAWRLFVEESWGLLLWWISGHPGGGSLPSLLTHNPPANTPSHLNPPVVDNSTVRKRRRPLYLVLAVFIFLSLWLFFSSYLIMSYTNWANIGHCTFNALYECPTTKQHTLLVLWVSIPRVGRWQHIKACFPFWPRDADWYAVACQVSTKTCERGKRKRRRLRRNACRRRSPDKIKVQ